MFYQQGGSGELRMNTIVQQNKKNDITLFAAREKCRCLVYILVKNMHSSAAIVGVMQWMGNDPSVRRISWTLDWGRFKLTDLLA